MKSDINLRHLTQLPELPKNWAHSSVDELCIIEPVGNKKLAQKQYVQKGKYPVIDQGIDFIGGYTDKNELVIEVPEDGAFIIFGDHSRAFKLVDFNFVPGADGVKVLRPVCVLPKWAYYFFKAIYLPNKGYARHFQYLKEAYLPLPPLSTQKLIVDKIEELFSHIDAGVEGLKQAKAKLQQYRQSVLKDAVTGKLTESWREQNADKLEPANELLERILEERRAHWEAEQLEAFKEKGKVPKDDKWKSKYKEPPKADISSLPEIPASWVWSTITQLGELNRGKSKHRPRNDSSLYGGDYPFVQTGDVRAADGLLTTYKQTYSDKGLAQSRLWPVGTMCITIAANIAETAILGIEACFPDSVVGFIPQNKNVSVEYIEFFFRTAKEDLDRYAPATAQKNINLAILETVSVPFMSVAEQQELVFQVSEKLDATNRAEATIDSKIKKSASFKTSILAKAFSGDLVPNDSNESAQELLDKIKAEKEKLIADKSKAKTKGKKKVTSERKPLLTILSEQSEAVTPDVLMQEAGFTSIDIDDFYVELASIAEKIDQISPEQDTLKNWPYDKAANIKIKLKD